MIQRFGGGPPRVVDRPELRLVRREDGDIERAGPWPLYIEIADTLITALGARALQIVQRDGQEVAAFDLRNGAAEYTLQPMDGWGKRVGTLVKTW